MSDDYTETIRDRHDNEAERAVLSACLISSPARDEAKRHITGADMYQPAHEAIWDAITRLERQGKAVDAVAVLGIVRTNAAALQALTSIVGNTVAMPDNVADYASTVRGWATRRRLEDLATRVRQQCLNPDLDITGFAAKVANDFAGLRDSGIDEDVHAITLAELLEQGDEEPDWLIPGMLERRDRLILTGDEGMGKSHLLRQFALAAAAGLNPWDTGADKYAPVRVMIIDCENSERQIKRRIRDIARFMARHGASDVADRVNILPTKRMDITRDKDLSQIHHELDAQQPEIVVIGPLYRLVPRAIQSDDEAAPVLAALDTIRDRGAALLIEAHSGHALKGSGRDMRPRGSSALLGWPEFGYGLRDIGTKGYCDFIGWRGQRIEREWPQRLRRAQDGSDRWLPNADTTDYGTPTWN